MEVLLLHKLFRQNHKADASPVRRGHMTSWRGLQIHESPETHEKYQKDINKGLSARQAVWIVEPMPHEV